MWELRGKREDLGERPFSPIGDCFAAMLRPWDQLAPSWEWSKLAWPLTGSERDKTDGAIDQGFMTLDQSLPPSKPESPPP